MSSPHDELCPPPGDDDELTLPRASINKMIKELVSKLSLPLSTFAIPIQ